MAILHPDMVSGKDSVPPLLSQKDIENGKGLKNHSLVKILDKEQAVLNIFS